MKYLKLFESSEFDDLENKLQEIIDLNNIDIDLDYIKDISASAIDIFRGNRIDYEKYIDIGDENDDDFESWQLVGNERINNRNEDGHNTLLNFYRLLFTTRKICYLTFFINIRFDAPLLSQKDPNVNLFKEEVKDIESKCKGENILFNNAIHTSIASGYSGERKISSIAMTFRKRLNISKDSLDNRKILPLNIITDFDQFINKYNISKDAENDLIKLLNKAKEG